MVDENGEGVSPGEVLSAKLTMNSINAINSALFKSVNHISFSDSVLCANVC